MLDNITIKDVKLKIGEWCKQYRQKYDMTQEDLAQVLEMSRLTIRKVEEGKNVTLDTLLKVVNHFDMLESLYNVVDTDISNHNINSLY
ncbi:helix-turn-helix transcriptional regulator [Flavobacterium branchiarum]|uniref:Helix-turn-helix transcriptional regulator n=1 Tax=Flavobacterium branchiarum TaxID=1114870 RepID=A0ABV5FQK7_9FLAO|nr:helix-turn-helix transcriptional regulator [Flavobacterium branchiarum]MDN3672979.1 helix-turn-helix transcriptional regulator [Flavobacterium branchiarum]